MKWPNFIQETAVLEKKSALGQYFTLPTVVEFMYEMLWCMMSEDDRRNPRIIDPACGEGIFLKFALDAKISLPNLIYGIDIDQQVAGKWEQLGLKDKINLYLQNGLLDSTDGKINTQPKDNEFGQFDIVIGNPPYGGEGIKNLSQNQQLLEKLKLFDLWQKTKLEEQKSNPELFDLSSLDIKLNDEQIQKIERTPIEILFLERFMQLAKPGKWVAIIVPDGILANSNLKYVRDWIADRAQVESIISLPRETFKHTGTTAKTSIMFLHKVKSGRKPNKKKRIFSAASEFVGVNGKNDLPEIVAVFKNYLKTGKVEIDHHSPTFAKKHSTHDDRWDPSFWDPKYTTLIKEMKKNWEVKKLGDLEPFITYGAITPGKKMPKLGNGIKYISQVHMKSTGLDFTEKPIFVKENSPWDSPRFRVKQKDILIARSGVASVGRTEIYTGKDITVVSCFVDIFRQFQINPFYIVVFMKSRYGKGQIERSLSGVGTVNIDFGDIKSIQIPIIPDKIQKKIEVEYQEMSKYHDKAMIIKEKLIKSGKTNKEAEQNIEYHSNIREAEQMLSDLIARVEEVIAGKRKDI